MNSIDINITSPKVDFNLEFAGERGKQGLSAYEIAVKNGFIGTEQEWLDSLDQDAKAIADDAKDIAAEAKTTAQDAKAVADDAKDMASEAVTSATNAANSAKAAADSATAAANSAREQQADWAVTDTTSKAFIKNKPEVLLKSGGTATGEIIAPSFQTGNDASHYFQCRKFRGEGNAETYYHAVDFGYAGHNQVDFYEYGGLWNFHKCQNGQAGTSTLVGSIRAGYGWNGLVKGQDITTYAKKSDLSSLENSISNLQSGKSGALTVKIFSTTATNAAPCATLTATAQSGYQFLCWLMVWTEGTVVHVHTNHPEISNAQIWATDSSAVAGKTIRGMALYVKEA